MDEQDKSAGELELERLARDNEFKRRKEELTPKNKRLWYTLWLFKKPNRAEELLQREAEANADIKLNEREKATEELEKILAAADEEAPEALKPPSRKERREQKRQAKAERKEQKREAKAKRKAEKKAKKQAKKSKTTAATSENPETPGE